MVEQNTIIKIILQSVALFILIMFIAMLGHNKGYFEGYKDACASIYENGFVTSNGTCIDNSETNIFNKKGYVIAYNGANIIN